MEQVNFSQQSLGEIVVDDFRAASIFSSVGIDFCCGGKKSLQQACEEKDMDIHFVVNQLNALKESASNSALNFKDWDLGFLSDYIKNSHHQYVLKTLPELLFYTEKIAKVHGAHHPELIEVADLFKKINSELLQHLKNEEEVLFPAIKKALENNSPESVAIIASEIARMSDEHEFAGGAMDRINVLTNGYKIPEDACNTYTVALNLLHQFEDDLHIHVHLENNILYPKALLLNK